MTQVMVRYKVKPDRCEQGPVVTELREIGSFRFFDGNG